MVLRTLVAASAARAAAAAWSGYGWEGAPRTIAEIAMEKRLAAAKPMAPPARLVTVHSYQR